MMACPFFSILIPTYNRSEFLQNAIGSVLLQTFSDWELIVVDDGSTDDTKKNVFSYKEKRIKYIYQQNAERSVARNNGIRHATGNYVCFLDSDDYMLPDFLEKLAQEILARNKPIAVFFSRVMVQNKEQVDIMYDIFPETDSIVKHVLSEYKVIQVSQAIIHNHILKNNLFDERFSLWEDTHLYLRLIAQYPYYNCNINGIVLVQHTDSTVIKGLKIVKMEDVNRYIFAIKDLQDNYKYLSEKNIEKKYFRNYIDAKLNMYLYQARINKQFAVAFHILYKLLNNKISFINLMMIFKLLTHSAISLFRK